MSRTQIKDHIIGNYEINNLLLSCFNETTCIQNNGYDRLAFGSKS